MDQLEAWHHKASYLSDDVASRYIEDRFRSFLGRYRLRREQRAVRNLLTAICLSKESIILDCPTGIGRWVSRLEALDPRNIVCVDFSPAMLRSFDKNLGGWARRPYLVRCDATRIPLKSGMVELSFCYALMKHLSEDDQVRVLNELARASDGWVLCSWTIQSGWRDWAIHFCRPGAHPAVISMNQLRSISLRAGLQIIAIRRCTTPIGLERVVLYRTLG